MALDFNQSLHIIQSELYSRSSQCNGGSSKVTLDYISPDSHGNTIYYDIGMSAPSHTIASIAESQLKRVIADIKREYGITYPVDFDVESSLANPFFLE